MIVRRILVVPEKTETLSCRIDFRLEVEGQRSASDEIQCSTPSYCNKCHLHYFRSKFRTDFTRINVGYTKCTTPLKICNFKGRFRGQHVTRINLGDIKS